MEKKNENGKVQLKGQLKLYIQWPAIMGLLLIAMNLWVYKMDHRAGILMAVFVLIYIIMVGGLYFYSKNIIMKDLVEFAAQYGICLLYTSPSPRDRQKSRMPSSA